MARELNFDNPQVLEAVGSASRNFYVWSDTDQKYAGTRIILVDTERSNWTWDAGGGVPSVPEASVRDSKPKPQ